MLFTKGTLLSALLAGQFAAAAYIAIRPRADVTQTIYSTKFVSASPSAAGTNSTDGLPLAPSISRLSIPLSSINNPINGLPVPSRTTRKVTSSRPTSTKASATIGINPINGLPVPTGSFRTTTTKKPTSTKAPIANSSAAAAIVGVISQVPKQSSGKKAAAGIASVLAQMAQHSTTKTTAGIVIVPVTTKQSKLEPSSSLTSTPSKETKARNLLASLSAAQA